MSERSAIAACASCCDSWSPAAPPTAPTPKAHARGGFRLGLEAHLLLQLLDALAGQLHLDLELFGALPCLSRFLLSCLEQRPPLGGLGSSIRSFSAWVSPASSSVRSPLSCCACASRTPPPNGAARFQAARGSLQLLRFRAVPRPEPLDLGLEALFDLLRQLRVDGRLGKRFPDRLQLALFRGEAGGNGDLARARVLHGIGLSPNRLLGALLSGTSLRQLDLRGRGFLARLVQLGVGSVELGGQVLRGRRELVRARTLLFERVPRRARALPRLAGARPSTSSWALCSR